MTQQQPLQIQIVSDIVCPWCIVGYKQLDKAMKETGIQAEITWHPFELNPNMPAEGQNLREHIMEKYGSTAEQSASTRERLVQIGADLGFEFNFNDDSRMHNTFLAHQLLHWAKSKDKQHELKLALFATHFTDGRNLGSVDVLADAAESVGLDREEALAVLRDGRFAEDIREEEKIWQQRGIRGVPATVIDQKHLVSGAQGEEAFAELLQRLASESA